MTMKKYIRNAGKPWTSAEVNKLRALAAGNTPARVIGFKLERPSGGSIEGLGEAP